MPTTILYFRNWEFEIDIELTKRTYENISIGGADSCICKECKNYVAYRDNVFPSEIMNLFERIGIDYKKEVEVTSFEIRANGLHQIGGWFHFKGRVLAGKDYRVPLQGGNGFTIDLSKISDNFEIGFAEGNDLTYFEDKNGLVQVEFMTDIPWVIDKAFESGQ